MLFFILLRLIKVVFKRRRGIIFFKGICGCDFCFWARVEGRVLYFVLGFIMGVSRFSWTVFWEKRFVFFLVDEGVYVFFGVLVFVFLEFNDVLG